MSDLSNFYRRPFFSIIIPCYNTNKNDIERLLTSINTGGGSDPNIAEIIVVDDRSTDTEYLDTVSTFANLNIKIVYVPEENENGIKLIHCPGNSKEYGVKAAVGKWITFIDHDDNLSGDNCLLKIKDTIEKSNESYMISSNILSVNPENNMVLREYIHPLNWTHGKFYNLDNFWNNYNFHYPLNLESHDDIAISSKVHCLMYKLKQEKEMWIEEFIYIWNNIPNSTSRKLYDGKPFLNYYFKDYIKSTMEVYIEEYNKDKDNMSEDLHEFYKKIHTDSILFMYFYLQIFKYYKYISNIDYDIEYDNIVKSYIKDFYKRFNINSEELLKYATNNSDNSLYENAKRGAKYTAYFVEMESFIDFIKKGE